MRKTKIKDNYSIEKKIILLCGGSGQVGKYLIEYFLNKKAIIINLDVINSLRIKNKNYFFLKTSLESEVSVKKNVKIIKKKFKKIDALVNLFHFKGGRSLKPKHKFFSEFHDYPFDIWKKTLNTNLNGTFLITKEILNLMIKMKSGSIVNFASTYGLVSPNYNIYEDSGINNPIAYATSKAAIINFTKYIAVHYAKKNIRANTISPGGIENIAQSKNFKNNYSKLTPMGRMAKPYEFNEAILFLISDASSYMTGTNLIVDGGWTAW